MSKDIQMETRLPLAFVMVTMRIPLMLLLARVPMMKIRRLIKA